MGELSGMPVNLARLPAQVKRRLASEKFPENYERACTAIGQCAALDECKDWADKAAAMASYAKQVKDRRLLEMARRIQLRARVRLGELLEAIPRSHNVPTSRGDGGRITGTAPNPKSRMSQGTAAGLSRSDVTRFPRLARIPREQIDQLIERSPPAAEAEFNALVPPCPVRRPSRDYFKAGTEYRLAFSGGDPGSLLSFRRWCEKHPAVALAKALSIEEADRIREAVKIALVWIDDFDRALPQGRPHG